MIIDQYLSLTAAPSVQRDEHQLEGVAHEGEPAERLQVDGHRRHLDEEAAEEKYGQHRDAADVDGGVRVLHEEGADRLAETLRHQARDDGDEGEGGQAVRVHRLTRHRVGHRNVDGRQQDLEISRSN